MLIILEFLREAVLYSKNEQSQIFEAYILFVTNAIYILFEALYL